MLFGREKPDRINPDELEPLLNSLFDRALSQFDKRMSSFGSDMRDSVLQFKRALESFENISAEPDLDDMYGVTASHLSGQKEIYTKALRHIIENLSLDDKTGPTVYERHKANTTRAEEAMNKILHTNFRFKQVLVGYANALKDFKAAYTAIEKCTKAMKEELERKGLDYATYMRIRNSISSLLVALEERNIGADAIAAMENELGRHGSAVGAAEESITALIDKKAATLSELRSKTATLSDRIVRATRPFERAAKKMDHVSASKHQLYPFVSDPKGTIRSTQDYADFTSLLKQLVSELLDGKIDVKNNNELAEAAKELLNADLYGRISELAEMRINESSIGEELVTLRGELAGLKEAGRSREALRTRTDFVKKDKIMLDGKISELCKIIEKQFEQQYGKRISIYLNIV